MKKTIPRLTLIGLTYFGLGCATAKAAPDCTSAKQPDASPFSLTVGGELRLRGEGWSNFNFDKNQNAVFGLSQLKLHTDIHTGDYLRFYLEGISALSTPRNLPGGQRSIDVDSIDLQNAYLDFKYPFGTPEQENFIQLRPGRQEINLGNQRLVSALAWVNTQRTFDGIRITRNWHGMKWDGIYAQVVKVSPWALNASSPKNNLYGLYGTMSPFDEVTADMYWLGVHNDQAVFQKVTGQEDRQTLGTRWVAKGPWDLDAEFEGAWQFGRFAQQWINAGFGSLDVNYKPQAIATWGQPQLNLGLNYASGDQSATDQNLNTFNQLYPLAHAYYSINDVLGRQNASSIHLGLAFTPLEKLKLKLKLHQFFRSSSQDDLYTVSGSLFRASQNNDQLNIGLAFDGILSYALSANLSTELGYSQFIPGAFIAETGTAETLHFVYLSSTYHF